MNIIIVIRTPLKVMRSERHSDLEEAVHVRLSRKQLPRFTDDGYVEYGLRVPQDVGGLFPQHRQHGNLAAATRSRRDPQVRFASTCLLVLSDKSSLFSVVKSVYILQGDAGADVEWILKAGGVVSRGTPNFFAQNERNARSAERCELASTLIQ